MKTRLVVPLIFFLLMGGVLYFTSDRVVSIAIVNMWEEVNTVEIIVDGKFTQKLEVAALTTPQEYIHLDLPVGFHTVLVRSQTCDINHVFEVFNWVGYNVNVEYYVNQAKQCDSFSSESYFSLTYK